MALLETFVMRSQLLHQHLARFAIRNRRQLQFRHVLELRIRIDVLVEPANLVLQQMQGARLASVARKGGTACVVYRADPVVQFLL